jgi:hypothetical protein
MALSAWLDVDMEGDIYDAYLANLIKKGEIPEGWIDDAGLRVLRAAKFGSLHGVTGTLYRLGGCAVKRLNGNHVSGSLRL